MIYEVTQTSGLQMYELNDLLSDMMRLGGQPYTLDINNRDKLYESTNIYHHVTFHSLMTNIKPDDKFHIFRHTTHTGRSIYSSREGGIPFITYIVFTGLIDEICIVYHLMRSRHNRQEIIDH